MLKNGRKYIEINPKVEKSDCRWIENIGTAWRRIGFADDLVRSINHQGWFTDREFQDEVFRGIVYRLPSRKSGPVYFVGYDDPNNPDCAFGEVRTDLEDDTAAAYAADRIAEIYAEKESEYQDAWRLGQRYQDTFETVESERALRSGLFAELRQVKNTLSETGTPTICSTIKAKIASTRKNIKAAYKERKEIITDNWLRGSQIEAFADGAGLTSEEVKALF